MGKGKGRGKFAKGKKGTKKKGKKKVDLEDLHHALQIQKFEAQEAANRPDKKGKNKKKKESKPEPTKNEQPAEEAPVQMSAYDSLLESLGVVSESSDNEMQNYDEEMMEEMGEIVVSADEDSEAQNEDNLAEAEEAKEEHEEEDDAMEKEAREVARDLMDVSESEEEDSESEAEDVDQFSSFDAVLTEDQKQVDSKWQVFDVPGGKVAATMEPSAVAEVDSFDKLPRAYEADEKLCKQWPSLGVDQPDVSLYNSLFASFNSYRDVIFPAMDHTNGNTIRALYSLHALNHVLKARRRVKKNSDKIRLAAAKPSVLAELEANPRLRDQGFTRPRVLIVAPFRSVAYELVQMIEKLCPNDEVMNRKRFEEEFAPTEDHGRTKMAEDWLHLFNGNYDDKFRIGISFSRKAIKLYAPFYSSDIIICSPLGLRLVTGLEGDSRGEVDFLSSIEMLIIDRADALRMQNWEHLTNVLDVMNRKPREMRDIDIRRIRPSVAAGESRWFRQTIVLADGANADYSNILVDVVKHDDRKKEDKEEGDEEQDVTMFDIRTFAATNYRGRQRYLVQYPSALNMPLARHMFHHCDCNKASQRHQAMYEYFESVFWPDVGHGLEQLLILASSYGDYMKIRSLLKHECVNFASLCEYSSNSDLSIKRRKFQSGEVPVMVITERFAWFRRYRMRGTKHVLFYGPPDTPIYNEVLSWIEEPAQATAITMFTKYDAMQLERVVGSVRTKTLVTSPPNKLFCYT